VPFNDITGGLQLKSRLKPASKKAPGPARAARPKNRIAPMLETSPIERQCLDKGLRLTEQRQIIARVLAESHDYPDVMELHRRVSMIDTRIALSTVYRTVRLFGEIGISEKHSFGDGRARVEQVPDKHHDHLIDLRSGKVVEFRSEQIERLQIEIAARLGYRLVDHTFELYGVPIDND
jgi:Fur family transcriptional regulator, ferric uptake regulator